jgi:hypothetical protein
MQPNPRVRAARLQWLAALQIIKLRLTRFFAGNSQAGDVRLQWARQYRPQLSNASRSFPPNLEVRRDLPFQTRMQTGHSTSARPRLATEATMLVAKELRELHKLAQDRRAASLALLRRRISPVASTTPQVAARLSLPTSQRQRDMELDILLEQARVTNHASPSAAAGCH